MNRLLLSFVVAGAFGASTALAHHTVAGRTHPKVAITQPLTAGGQTLAPGSYDIWITDERPDVGAGAPSDNQRVVQFVQHEKVVATEIAEVFPRAERPVATSGTSGVARVEVQALSGGEFWRIVITDPDARYLIHLPTGGRAAR
jgi:hypothetical protein